ncbi:hypothetical protein RZS08_07555 [Arthrospira platensis SPKY1]|nr:hypothetical protein [Arthrospira platensis SPKY1]
MKQYEQQGIRLRQLLELRFQRQADAAKALGCRQPDISRYCNQFNDKPLPTYFWNNYAKKLSLFGLNPEYLVDVAAPKLLPEYAKERAEALRAELKELKKVAHV